MMKKILHLPILIALLLIFVFTIGCEREEDFNTNNQDLTQEKDLNIKVHFLNFEKLKLKKELQTTLQKIEPHLDINLPNDNERGINSNNNSFTILTDEIVQLLTDSTETYTFRIENPTDSTSTFENFILKKESENVYSYSIYRYYYNANQEDFNYDISIQTIPEDEVDIMAFNDYINSRFTVNVDGCQYTIDDVCTCSDCDGSGEVTCVQSIVGVYCESQGGGSNTGGTGTGGADTGGTNTGTGGTGTGGTDTGAGYTGGSGGTGGTTNGNSNPWGYIQPPVAVLPLDQYITDIKASIRNCLGSYILDNGNTTVNEWLDNTDFSIGTNFINLKRLESFLNAMPTSGNLEAPTGEPNCSNPQAQAFAVQAIEATQGSIIDYEERIVLDSTFVNNPRLKCVYDKFKAGNNTISNYLNNFLIDNVVGHLNFKADSNFSLNYPNSTTAGALTSPPVNAANNSNVVNYNIDIIFNTDRNLPNSSAPNKPTIILAVELIHEMVHAEMYRKLLGSAQLPHVNWQQYTVAQWRNFIYNLRNNYEGLYTYYTRYYFDNPNPTSPQHNLIASHYRNMVIVALREFDNNQHTDAFYEALSWIGLRHTVAWDNYPNQTIVNTTITNAIANETTNCTN